MRSVDAQSDSTSLPQSQTVQPVGSVIVEDVAVDEEADVAASVIAVVVEAVVVVDEEVSVIVEDEEVVVAVDAVEAPTVEVSVTSRARRRLSKSVEMVEDRAVAIVG